MNWVWEILPWLGTLVIGLSVSYALMRATNYRKKHDED